MTTIPTKWRIGDNEDEWKSEEENEVEEEEDWGDWSEYNPSEDVDQDDGETKHARQVKKRIQIVEMAKISRILMCSVPDDSGKKQPCRLVTFKNPGILSGYPGDWQKLDLRAFLSLTAPYVGGNDVALFILSYLKVWHDVYCINLGCKYSVAHVLGVFDNVPGFILAGGTIETSNMYLHKGNNRLTFMDRCVAIELIPNEENDENDKASDVGFRHIHSSNTIQTCIGRKSFDTKKSQSSATARTELSTYLLKELNAGVGGCIVKFTFIGYWDALPVDAKFEGGGYYLFKGSAKTGRGIFAPAYRKDIYGPAYIARNFNWIRWSTLADSVMDEKQSDNLICVAFELKGFQSVDNK